MSNTPQPVRVNIRRLGAPAETGHAVQVAADPDWRLLDLILNLPPAQRGGAEVVRWQFQLGDQVLASTERIRDVCARCRGTEYWVGGVLWLDLYFVANAPAPDAIWFDEGDAPADGKFDVQAQAPPSEPAGGFELSMPDEDSESFPPASAPPSPAPLPPRSVPGSVGAAAPAPVKRKAPAEDIDERRLEGAAPKKARRTERRATVRYYTRMNPDRMFPLLVILSEAEIAEIVKAKVKQAQSEAFEVDEGSVVEVEPVLPGCDCYPPRATLTVDAEGHTSATIWVVPKVLGRVQGARVIVRQGARVLAEVPLDVKVAKQTLAVACGLLSLAAPYLTMGLKSLKLDYESQKAEGFPLYQQAGNWVVANLRPEWIGLGFLGLAVLLYLWMRPRRRDVFWDVNPK